MKNFLFIMSSIILLTTILLCSCGYENGAIIVDKKIEVENQCTESTTEFDGYIMVPNVSIGLKYGNTRLIPKYKTICLKSENINKYFFELEGSFMLINVTEEEYNNFKIGDKFYRK